MSGTVLDFQTQAPISGAAVRVGIDFSGGGGIEAVTAANGRYTLPPQPRSARAYYFAINDRLVGGGFPVVTAYRGDLLVDSGTCVSRYGVALDARTLRPVEGVFVQSSGSAVTASDGWYRIDWGCPSSGHAGFNTTFLTVQHPNYVPQDILLGRGIFGVSRLDFLLEPR